MKEQIVFFPNIVSDNISAMMAYWDKELICRYANNAYLNWFGKTKEEMVDKINLKELLGSIYELNKPYIEGALRGEKQEFERAIKTPSGEIKYSQANYNPDIYEGKVRGFVVHESDITRLKKLEKELSDSEYKLMSFFESAPDAVVIIDQSGLINYVNTRAEELFGYSRVDLIGENSEILIPIRHREAHSNQRLAFVSNTNPNEKALEVEMFAVHKNGSEFPVELSTKSFQMDNGIYLYGSIKDISGRKEAERKINELANITTFSSDAIISKSLDGTILTWNKAAEKIFGYDSEEIIGRNIKILFPTELLAEEGILISQILEGKTVETFETVRIRKDKTKINASVNLYGIWDKSGNLVSICKILRDITKQKAAELELKVSNDRNKIFIEQSPNAIAMFDKEMRYMAASQKWVEDYKLVGKEIIGHSHYEIFPEIGDD